MAVWPQNRSLAVRSMRFTDEPPDMERVSRIEAKIRARMPTAPFALGPGVTVIDADKWAHAEAMSIARGGVSGARARDRLRMMEERYEGQRQAGSRADDCRRDWSA